MIASALNITKKNRRARIQLAVLSVALVTGTASSYGADGTWNGDTTDGQWATGGNWVGNVVAGNNSGAAATSTDTATFVSDPIAAPGPANVAVDLNRNIQNLTFNSTTHSFRIGDATNNTGNTLYLSSGGTMTNTGNTASINGDLAAPVQFSSTYTFVNNNALGGLRLLGTATAAPTGTVLTLDGSHGSQSSSQTEINGALVDNLGGGALSVVKNGSGTWEMNSDASRPNTYSGDTTINGGILRSSTATGFNGQGGFSPNSHYIINNGGTLRNSVVGSTVKKITVNFGGLMTVSTAASTVLNIKSESGPGLVLNFATPINTTAIGFPVPFGLTGTTANAGGVQLLAASGASGTGEVSLGNTSSPFNLGDVQRTFDVAEGNDANDYDLRTRGVVSGSGGITKTGAGILRLDGTANTYTGATIVSAGVLELGGVITTPSNTNPHFRTSSSLTVADGAKFVMRPRNANTPSDARVLQVPTLNLNTSGTLDMTDNDLVIDNGSYSDTLNLVLSGFGGAGPGITSSSSDGSQILALFDNAQVGATDWEGGPVGANAVIGKYTYFGDANIDGQVTGDDYGVIDANLDTTPVVGLGWLSGDMNLDGSVTGDDYGVIDANLGLGTSSPLSPSALTAVPEPGLATVAMSSALLFLRRRRSH